MVGSLVPGSEPYVALALLLLLLGAFVWERYPPDVTAAGGAALFVVLGFVSPDKVMAAFSNTAPITIAAMFVISGALVRTGLLDALANLVVGRARDRPRLAIAIFLVSAVIASAFVNNTPVVLVLIPVVIRLAGSLDIAPTRLLIPLSYVSILGGTCTLIGTSSNILVDGVARAQGLEPFSIFEIAPVGLIAAACGGLVLLLLGRFLLPDRRTTGPDSAGDETEFLSQVTILADSPLIGRRVGEVSDFRPAGLRLIGLQRGPQLRRGQLDDHELRKGDTLSLMASTSELLTLRETPGLRVGLSRNPARAPAADAIVAEAIVTPSRNTVGERAADLAMVWRHNMSVLGAHRHNHVAGRDLASVRLRPADKLLIEGPAEGFDALAQVGDLVSITRPGGRAYRRRRAPMAVMALAAVVGLSAFDIAGIDILALVAVAALLLLRCIDNDEAWGSIDASILVLIFSMLIVGAGLQQTGAVELVVDQLGPALGGLPPFVTLIAVYAITSILTELVTNNAVAVVLTPIVIGLATQIGADPRPFVVAVMFGASASFATPIGYQTNTLVYGAGDYRFSDFLRIGVPMNILVGAVVLVAISVFFPL